jgi:hypothetical protein
MSFLYAILFSSSFMTIVWSIFYTVIVDFLLVGIIVTTACWYFCNHYLRQVNIHSIEQEVEWAYSFDVHCNASFPTFLLTYGVQFLLYKIIVDGGYFGQFLGNTLYLIAILVYLYLTFLGYQALPFIHNAQIFLYPSAILFILYIVSLFTINVPDVLMEQYRQRFR